MDKARLAVNLGALRLKNPVMTASGTFGYGLEFAPYGNLDDLGGIVVKGISLQPRQGNPMPRVAESAGGMLNAVGLQNIGVEAFIKEKLPKLPWKSTSIVVNIYAQDAAGFAELADILAAEEGVAALEVNISCPNVSAGGIQFGQDPRMAAEVTESVKKKAGRKPVAVKLSPNVTDITVIAKAVEEAGADILTCINTLRGLAVDVKSRKPRMANVVGGLSGPAIKPVALRCVQQVCAAVSIPVIGVGGIACAEDILEFIMVGATAVQIGTANFIRPDSAFIMLRQLPELMAQYNISSLEAFRGALQLP